MITREDVNNIATRLFLSDIIDFIPINAKVKRKTIEGMIQRKTPERELQKLSLNECLNFEENNKVIELFINTLEERFSHCDLSSFYENIRSLRIIQKDKTLLEKLDELFSVHASGTYYIGENKIRVYSSENENNEHIDGIKTHELLHLATTRKVKNMTLCGFERTSNGISFATGLNEGYTEMLNREFFSHSKFSSYQELQPIVSQIELLVGKRQMQAFYFSNDLNGLIESMEKYTSREDALKLIQKLDYIYKCYGKPGEKRLQKKLCREARVDIANIQANKYRQQYESGKINEGTLKERLFALELFTHNYEPLYLIGKETKKVEAVAICDYLTIDSKVKFPIERYDMVVKRYYESKKTNPTYTYEPWHDETGLGIENLLIREINIQAMEFQESQKGRDTAEVQRELNQMFAEHPEKIPAKATILKQW